jgi:1-deoxy-D-xylulose 5-phosphate reductoisomerase
VAEFVAGKLPFTGIAELVGRALAAVPAREPGSLGDVLAADADTRITASRLALGLAR